MVATAMPQSRAAMPMVATFITLLLFSPRLVTETVETILVDGCISYISALFVAVAILSGTLESLVSQHTHYHALVSKHDRSNHLRADCTFLLIAMTS